MLPPMDTAAVLARNDRYLREFVESFQICPFARSCRERGGLLRDVVAGEGEALLEPMMAALRNLHAPQFAHIEVALLIAPEFGDDARAFEQFANRLATAVRADLRREGADLLFHVVAFHPHLRGSDADPWRLVGLLRRTPDPTLQVVRISVIDSVKGEDAGQTRYVAPEDVHKLDALPRKGVSERIADANWATWRAHGEILSRLLPGLERPTR